MKKMVLRCVHNYYMEDDSLAFAVDDFYVFHTESGKEDYYVCKSDYEGTWHAMCLEDMLDHFTFIQYEE